MTNNKTLRTTTCTKCKGSGQIQVTDFTSSVKLVQTEVCPCCNGKGTVEIQIERV